MWLLKGTTHLQRHLGRQKENTQGGARLFIANARESFRNFANRGRVM